MNIGDKLFRIWGTETSASSNTPPSQQSPLPNIDTHKEEPDSHSSTSPSAAKESPNLDAASPQVNNVESPRLVPLSFKDKPLEPSRSPVKTAPSRTLRHKASIASVSSANGNYWLNWASKPAPPVTLENTASHSRHSSSGAIEDLHDEKCSELDEQGTREQGSTMNCNPTSNSNESDLKSQENENTSKRSRAWSFWRSAEELEDRKEIIRPARATNQILKFTPPTQSNESFDSQSLVDARAGDSKESSPDDAVLYKSHHSAKEFNKINTHKNENIAQNIIVPDWDLCLPAQNIDSAGLEAFAGHGIPSSSFDLKSWVGYLSKFSLRFSNKAEEARLQGSPLTGPLESAHHEHPEFNGEKYKLYGKSLTRLPYIKRACLRTEFQNSNQETYQALKRQKTHAGEDFDENDVSVTSESNGKLLINPEIYPVKHSSSVMDKLKSQIGIPSRIKRILVIGVHGFFPTKMIRPLIGNPTGTSSKFANEAEKAIIRYCVENDMMSETDARDMSIRKIALEKEGKIFDRIAFFLEVLTKWQVELNEADCIFFAAHSQGCVVSIILLARLINEGILKNASHKKLGILGMAGVNNGPFYGVDKSLFMKAYSTFEHDSMLELFELTKFNSPQSIAYKDAIKTIIAMNCKICFIGSIDDQLVPLYSALASHIYHPNIYRACYIDQSAKAPQFVTRLVLLCLQLQNLGYFDNGVIKELSAVLAGPITGGGHSKIYNDGKVYDLGVKFLLDTSDIVQPVKDENYDTTPAESHVHVKEYNVSKLGTNPFILPWCLRGLLFNVEKNWRLNGTKSEEHPSGAEEVKKLYDLYDSWRADTKIYKELKFRLNGIRTSKL